jgi:hypothetical protein
VVFVAGAGVTGVCLGSLGSFAGGRGGGGKSLRSEDA